MSLFRRKQAQLQNTLTELGEEALEEQMQAAGEFPVTPAHRFATLIEVSLCCPAALLLSPVNLSTYKDQPGVWPICCDQLEEAGQITRRKMEPPTLTGQPVVPLGCSCAAPATASAQWMRVRGVG